MKSLPWILAGVGVGAAIAYVLYGQPRTAPATGWGAVEDAAASTLGWGSRNRLAGVGSRVAGAVKEGVGRLTGDADLADRGAADRTGGVIQEAAGAVAEAAGQTLRDLNR